MGDADLVAQLERPLPASLSVGQATAVLCYGHCFHRHQRLRGLEIVVDGASHEVSAYRMPRLDLLRALHPAFGPDTSSAAGGDPTSREDPELRCYRSGFWATIPIGGRSRPGTVELRARALLADGTTAVAGLGAIQVVDPPPARAYELPATVGSGLIAICMATFEPDPNLFRAQIESIRAQTDSSWICLISDDDSSPERLRTIEETVAGDPRFVLSRGAERVGFYKNFERALEMVPPEVELVALCDQDDRWYPDKLAVLRAALGTAELAYSDQRLVDPDGTVLRDTFWFRRRNNHTNLASLLVANTIVGAASLFRRRLLDLALPFPDAVGWEFHDHWLGIVAMATGEISYVDRPLYDYVQHRGAVLGRVSTRASDPGLRWWRRVRGAFDRWRSAYFFGYLPVEVQVSTLLARSGERLGRRPARVLSRYVAASRSLPALVWWAVRPVRELVGRNETLGAEWMLVKGLLWRRLIEIRARRRELPGGARFDASLPSAYNFTRRRLQRWQARRLATRPDGT